MSLERFRLIDHPAGRSAMVGWIVVTPEGRKMEIVSVDEPEMSGRCSIAVAIPGSGGRVLSLFSADQLKTVV